MLDTSDRDDGRQIVGVFRRFAELVAEWSEAPEESPVVDDAEVDVAEANDVKALVELGDADDLSGQRLADEEMAAAPLDLAVGADAADLMVGVVPGVFEPVREGPRRGRPVIGRRGLVQRLVRPLIVVVAAEGVEAGLLLGQAGRRRIGGLRLQGPVHALVAAVLLRRGGPDVVGLHAA